MVPYEIVFQPSVEKDLRKLSVENCDRIMVRIEALAQEPFPAQFSRMGRLLSYPLRERTTSRSPHPLFCNAGMTLLCNPQEITYGLTAKPSNSPTRLSHS